MSESNGKKDTRPQPQTIKLRYPIEFGSQTVTELTIGRLKGKHLRGLPTNDLDVLLKLAGKLTGQPDPVIDELEDEDLADVLLAVSLFMPSGPKTGSESAES